MFEEGCSLRLGLSVNMPPLRCVFGFSSDPSCSSFLCVFAFKVGRTVKMSRVQFNYCRELFMRDNVEEWTLDSCRVK